MNFSSDNWAGASPRVASALTEANHGLAPAYGADDLTRTVDDWFAEVFERTVDVLFVATGTAANSLALGTAARAGGIVLAHETSHIAVDEAGAPEFFTGGRVKLMTIAGDAGKLTPEGLAAALEPFATPAVHHGRPVAVSLTQASEWGTVYSLAEIRALAAIAHRHGLMVHMDGARFANAMVALNVSAAEMTWKAGVDILSFGATKNGCWCAEAVVAFRHGLADDLAYARKQAGQLFSKSRFVAAQFEGYFDQGHWLDNALHANAMAARLAEGIAASPDARLALRPEANEVFAIWPMATGARLKAAGARYYPWPGRGLAADSLPGDGEEMARLVTSFATTAHEVDAFLQALRKR